MGLGVGDSHGDGCCGGVDQAWFAGDGCPDVVAVLRRRQGQSCLRDRKDKMGAGGRLLFRTEWEHSFEEVSLDAMTGNLYALSSTTPGLLRGCAKGRGRALFARKNSDRQNHQEKESQTTTRKEPRRQCTEEMEREREKKVVSVVIKERALLPTLPVPSHILRQSVLHRLGRLPLVASSEFACGGGKGGGRGEVDRLA